LFLHPFVSFVYIKFVLLLCGRLNWFQKFVGSADTLESSCVAAISVWMMFLCQLMECCDNLSIRGTPRKIEVIEGLLSRHEFRHG